MSVHLPANGGSGSIYFGKMTLRISRKVMGSRPDKANEFYKFLILLSSVSPGVYSAHSRNDYQEQKKMFLGSRARPADKADNLTVICDI
jgi:hypothetical protein